MVDESKVIDNMNLVYHILHRYYPKYVRNEDVVQSAMLSLCRAVDTYDESFGTTFSTYASRCIINAIKKEIRENNKHGANVSFDFNYEDERDENLFSISDYIKTDDNNEIDEVHIEEFKDTLDERELNVYEYRMLGYTVGEISKITGYGTHQNISLILKKIQRKWRKYNENKN